MLQHRLIPKFFLNDRLVIYPIWKKGNFVRWIYKFELLQPSVLKKKKLK